MRLRGAGWRSFAIRGSTLWLRYSVVKDNSSRGRIILRSRLRPPGGPTSDARPGPMSTHRRAPVRRSYALLVRLRVIVRDGPPTLSARRSPSVRRTTTRERDARARARATTRHKLPGARAGPARSGPPPPPPDSRSPTSQAADPFARCAVRPPSVGPLVRPRASWTAVRRRAADRRRRSRAPRRAAPRRQQRRQPTHPPRHTWGPQPQSRFLYREQNPDHHTASVEGDPAPITKK